MPALGTVPRREKQPCTRLLGMGMQNFNVKLVLDAGGEVGTPQVPPLETVPKLRLPHSTPQVNALGVHPDGKNKTPYFRKDPEDKAILEAHWQGFNGNEYGTMRNSSYENSYSLHLTLLSHNSFPQDCIFKLEMFVGMLAL